MGGFEIAALAGAALEAAARRVVAVLDGFISSVGGLIAAGGYGQPIIIGLAKNSNALILEGAIPAMVLALVVQGLFEVAERFLVPRGLRLPSTP